MEEKIEKEAQPKETAAQVKQEKKKAKKAAQTASKAAGKFFSDFKKFAFKGNIIDLALAVIIGTAFSKIVSSLVADVIMPCIGALIGDVDLSNLKVILRPETASKAEVAFRYGLFLQTIIEFLIIALSIFLVYKTIMWMRSANEKRRKKHGTAEEATPAEPLTKTEELLTEIKDALINTNKKTTTLPEPPVKNSKTKKQ